MNRINQAVYVSATPREFETGISDQVVEQIIRPTGLVDPNIEVRPIEGQIDDLYGEINKCVENNERVLVTTLTIKMAEDLTDFFKEHRVKAKYLHHDIDTIERMELLHDLRTGEYDVLVGINLLREGLDLPEVSLVAILDADKEGFLRSEISLVQTIGRAARNINGRVIMYADRMTGSMERAIGETERRREIQLEFNEKNNITPQTIRKSVRDVIKITQIVDDNDQVLTTRAISKMTKAKAKELTLHLEEEMKQAAKDLEYEKAAELRDLIADIKKRKKIS
jgi:excinuclease ABC subunit B